MKQYLKYFKYISTHKFYVAEECFKEKLYWRGLVHDLSKFLPSEFAPYANFFFNKLKQEEGYYKPTETGDTDFDFAWFLHQKRNSHHWQWWIVPEKDGTLKVLEMSHNAVREMICDWVGAGKAQGFHSPKNNRYHETRVWYINNKSKMNLHPKTIKLIEKILWED